MMGQFDSSVKNYLPGALGQRVWSGRRIWRRRWASNDVTRTCRRVSASATSLDSGIRLRRAH